MQELEPGDVPVARPLDDVELRFYGLADNAAGPMLILATVERDGGNGLFTYSIDELDENERTFIASPGRQRHDRAEESIEAAGGTIRTDDAEG